MEHDHDTHDLTWSVELSPTRAESAKVGPSPVIDLADVMRRLDGDRELFDELASFFREDAPSVMAQLEHAMERRDCREVHQAAHVLKGMSANLSARGASESARQLEQLAKEQRRDEMPTAFAVLSWHIEAVLMALPRLTHPRDDAADSPSDGVTGSSDTRDGAR